MTGWRSVPLACGSYLPAQVISNHDLAQRVQTSDEWIVERTGIKKRHVAAQGELTSDLASKASHSALTSAGLQGSDLDLIVLATSTPDETFPATATALQAQIGMHHGFAFDLQAVCSGFVYALAVADNFLKCGQGKRALVVGAETFSRIVDWNDRNTCVLFGDGAGALILEAQPVGPHPSSAGVLSTHLHSDGRSHDLLYVDGGPSSTGTVGKLRMRGKEVFKHAVINLADVVEEALAANKLQASDIDWVIPHQANKRILESTARRFAIPEERVIVTIEDHANTSAASIPLALHRAVSDGRVQRGDLLLLEAMGGGFTWGAVLMRW